MLYINVTVFKLDSSTQVKEQCILSKSHINEQYLVNPPIRINSVQHNKIKDLLNALSYTKFWYATEIKADDDLNKANHHVPVSHLIDLSTWHPYPQTTNLCPRVTAVQWCKDPAPNRPPWQWALSQSYSMWTVLTHPWPPWQVTSTPFTNQALPFL